MESQQTEFELLKSIRQASEMIELTDPSGYVAIRVSMTSLMH